MNFQRVEFKIHSIHSPALNETTRHRIITSKPTKFGDHFQKAKMLAATSMECNSSSLQQRNRGFRWHIRSNWYKCKPYLYEYLNSMKELIHKPKRARGCPYATVNRSKRIEKIADRIWEDILATYAKNHTQQLIAGVLLVRRGDRLEECDTSLAKMKHFLKCSYKPVLGKDTLLLFTSNEADPSYSESIRHIVENDIEPQSSGNGLAMHNAHNEDGGNGIHQFAMLDEIILKKLGEMEGLASYQNNYHVFSIANALGERAHFKWHQRGRVGCVACDPVAIAKRS
mmetsp:Transcript_24187/g.68113  ORF Transcript_24187/g.68113 Transcript_24187/m.68113 type:complete len:284 (-) Transcript_24187:1852-2703(-)